MSSIAYTVGMGVAGAFLVKGVHIAIPEIYGDTGTPEISKMFREKHASYSTLFKVMNVFEHGLLIPFGEEGLFRALPAALSSSPLVNFAISPLFFGWMHYDPQQGDLNKPYVLSQIASAVIFAALLKTGGFPAAFTAHAVSNFFTVYCLLN